MKKILVIDDEQDLVDMLKYALEAQGYIVVTAFDGLEGLEKTKKEKPDLIMLDYMMPKLDGLSFIEEIGLDEDLRKTPIIVLTGKDFILREFAYRGRCQFFNKPFDIDEVLKRIKMIFR
ncbi:hypothetical protein MNBD_UNCLBAC01-1224 [hydrothermal vent metagenome]|uniref:Response regulatory domain-containing protein n=1 Tax=hydrothermal vent metagenome TaxID=652676 RepID=A0A3B1E074_9ZZZZ